MINLTLNGAAYINFTPAQLLEAGVPQSAITAALVAKAQDEVASQASALRAQVVSTDPAKLQEYAIKEAIALAPKSASKTETALLTAEAAARGLELPELLAVIKQRATALRSVALGIAVWEATAKAAFDTLDPDSKEPAVDLANIIATNAAAATALMEQASQPAPASQPVFSEAQTAAAIAATLDQTKPV